MGRALITSGGANGRYAIQVDYGSAQRDALIAALNQLIAKYNTAIDGQAAAMATLAAREAETKEQIRIASNGITPPGYADEGAPLDDDLKRAIITIGRENLLRIQMALRPLQLNGDKMKFERADALAKIATLTTATATVNKDAWCCTFTEDASPGATVATIDINGESNLTLVAPEARAWTPADGVMTMPHVMSPAQSFFNTAILPGWQKHRPAYRWGTISSINYDENTASVNLAAATSSAQNLNINTFSTLSGIPVQYMTCDAAAFTDGDRVVVQYIETLPGQYDAKVIGFLDNPKACQKVDIIYRWRAFFAPPAGLFTYPLEMLLTDQETVGRNIEPFTAPAKLLNGQPNKAVFLGWLDGVTNRTRSDGKAKKEGLDVTAAYLVMPITIRAWVKTHFSETGVVISSAYSSFLNLTTYVVRGQITQMKTLVWYGVNGEGALADIATVPLETEVGPFFDQTFSNSGAFVGYDGPPEDYETVQYQGYLNGMPATITRSISYTPGGDLPAQTVMATYSDTTPQSGSYTQTNIVRL